MSNELNLLGGILLFIVTYLIYIILLWKGYKEEKIGYCLIAVTVISIFFFLAGVVVRNAW